MLKEYKVNAITPIYKEEFSSIEQFSISHSLDQLKNISHTFFHPKDINLSYYINLFPNSKFMSLPNEFFSSQRHYNQLCYEIEFYKLFSEYSHILILQPDAIVANADLLKDWCQSDFAYVGGPESNLFSYDIRGIPPFDKLSDSLHPVKLQGLNGGLSLRRVDKIIEALEEYPELTSFFRAYSGGVGEDIFFCLLARVTNLDFKMPNEVAASKFSITCNFKQWMDFNSNELPFGFHAWYKNYEDENFVLNLLRSQINEVA